MEPNIPNTTASTTNINPINQAPDASPILSQWPGAFGIYKTSKAAITSNLVSFISLWVIIGLISILFSTISSRFKSGPTYYLLEFIFNMISLIISATLIYAIIESVKGKKVTVGDAYSAISSKMLNVLLVNILVAFLSILSIVVFIIPAFFVIPRIYMSIYFVMDKNMSAIDAIKASWNATEHHIGKIYGIFGVELLIILPAITIIGIVATIYFGIMYYAATGVLYAYLTNNRSQIDAI